MKYFCVTNMKLTKSREDLIYTMHPRVKAIINGLDSVSSLEAGDIVVFDDILELDPEGGSDTDTIISNYKMLLDKGLEILFDRSSNLDSDIVLMYAEQIDIDTLLQIKIIDYQNIKNSLFMMKQYAQRKYEVINKATCGRPRGTRRISEKAQLVRDAILANSKEFGGTMSDQEIIKATGVSSRSYYMYKNDLKKEKSEELNNNADIQ